MQENVLLKDYTTMRIGGPATRLVTVVTKKELVDLVELAGDTPILILGQGSNLIVGDKGFDGLVILNRITGFEIYDQNPTTAKIKIGAGEIWDDIVRRTTESGLSGIECLSAIPGCAGAGPVQNIGAYGQEIADTLIELEAYDRQAKSFVKFSNSDCDFTYRKSIFSSSTDRNRYVVVGLTLELAKTKLQPPFYSSLQAYLDKNQITDYSPSSLRQAVSTIRAVKLPDPEVIPNSGSFFKNPIIEKWQAEKLQIEYPDMKIFPMGDNLCKVAAGWLVEQVEIKGVEMEGFKVYEKNALVIVNNGAQSYQGLGKLKDYIIGRVRDKFRITLEQESEEIGI